MLGCVRNSCTMFFALKEVVCVMSPRSVLISLIICFLFFTSTNSEDSATRHPLRWAKCLIPKGTEHITRAALLQQCISKNYGLGNETRCYQDLGCFPVDSPWTSMLRPFPAPLPPAEINTRIYCYTRESPTRFNVTLWPEISLNGCPFSALRPTLFITHGFASNGNSSWLGELKDKYFQIVDSNVFLVDWGQGAELLNYLQVASNTRIVGAELARFIKFLRANHGLDSQRLHLVGHSLGAHISAYAAKAVPGVYRLTALDPAQPGFEGEHKSVRLDKEDATFVEVVHTNAAPFIPTLGFGLIWPHGHVDFYMNGGLTQPGCHIPNVTEIKSIHDLAKIPVEVLSIWVSCSHGRSYEYYMEALQHNCKIWGRLATLPRHLINYGTLGFIEPIFSRLKRCDANSCIPLGLETPVFQGRGTFAVTTPRISPYCESDPEANRRILSEIKGFFEESTTKVAQVVGTMMNKTSGLIGKLKGLGGIG